MGVPFVIHNKPCASYVIGTMEVVRATPDCYTLGYGNIVSLATNRAFMPKVPYEVDKNLTLISGALRVVNVLVVNNNLPVKTVPELIAYARKNSGKLVQGSAGNGTSGQLGGELLRSMTQTSMLHVRYKAVTAAITDLIGGDVHLMLENTPVLGPHVQAGRMRALGISGTQRSPNYPDIPTIAESVPGFKAAGWGGIIGPANMPKDIVTRLNAEIRTALVNPAV
ncbi:tripartite tricarboxylate transporter substrate-binding protein [Rhodoferax sp.]|uniref:Bug family tripartite tricarboxylate transporter substrate binding protein n=1 Tax=Rhodoferax sp. TaxID=50421 RepID=UPI0025FC925E|nr:tripartite tricarboxylate transporter substrate-binding protein [Rhodoferax sp.]